ncbi:MULTISPECIES: DUF1906 domain-containing protein [Rhodococcus]|uniref:DUF1906 domain-containing protein n=1 Tax=Rhodococcus cerastii TaxID=908616 RepID=A0ABU4D1V1_9NOCA|nr:MULTISPECIES: DUF1906 domain-containing protein [Rhodococcus]MDV6303698.1 DUF1906 domain-containing protein [Rhodococcus cerastii]MDV8057446.1 DUF1906 domain-containing protein [Rhodococcus sp. IEGM 1343]
MEIFVQVSRRELFKYAAAGSAAAVGLVALGSATAHADAGLGTLVDYSGGVPSASAIKNAGHLGAVRYVSDRRPDANWMIGKPMRKSEADALTSAGLEVVSNYQFGKGTTSDWRGGYAAGVKHAERGLELHLAAGGPADRPIYASIDDNPTAVEFATLIAPYILGWQSVIGAENTGIYANSPTIELASVAALGRWYWQHNWGTPKGFVHPDAHIHQIRIDKDFVGGVKVDINNILKADYGQWSKSAADIL